MKEKIAVFRSKFPLTSEVFITEQVQTSSLDVDVWCRDIQQDTTNTHKFAVRKLVHGSLSRFIFSVTGCLSSRARREMAGVRLIHAHFGQDGFYAMRIAQQLKIPYVVTFHGQDCTVSDVAKLRSGQLANFLYLLFRRKILRNASAVIAVSHFIKRTLIDQGCDPGKLHVHYIGVDLQRFQPQQRPRGGNENTPLILCVGRHTEKKGLTTLLGALARVKSDYQLVQIGTGEMHDDLCNLAGELGISDKVSFMGAATSAVVADYMAKADLFVLPSKTAKNGDSEAFGIVFIEAAASGLPVVATLHGGIPEAVNNGVNGFLVGEGDEVELAHSIEKLLISKELRDTFGEAGRRFVETKFDIRQQSKLLDRIYMGMLGIDD